MTARRILAYAAAALTLGTALGAAVGLLRELAFERAMRDLSL